MNGGLAVFVLWREDLRGVVCECDALRKSFPVRPDLVVDVSAFPGLFD